MEFKNLVELDFKDILGQDNVKKQLKSTLLSKRNVILVGQPGIGKTTLAKNVAKLIPKKKLNDCEYHCSPDKPVCSDCKSNKSKTKEFNGNDLFIRIQGSPDLTSEDLLGDIDPIKAMKFGPLSQEAFTPGKIFRANQGILFFDEINRCSEKLQNALLQSLEEKKVTIGSYKVDFDVNFIFIGTMNPDDNSTEPLSDVFMDRFDLIYMEYPESLDLELQIVKNKGKKIVDFPDDLLARVITFIRDLRQDENVEKKPSVRASLGIYERAQANAVVNNRSSVTSQDVSDILISVLAHRITLKPSVKYLKKPDKYIFEKHERFNEEIVEKSDYL